MADKIQILRRIGACENREAQPDWQGPAIPPCSEPPSFLCESCGRLLCGGHAGGHWHPASDTTSIAAHAQDEAAKAQANCKAAAANAEVLRGQLATAQQQVAKLDQIKALLASAPTAA